MSRKRSLELLQDTQIGARMNNTYLIGLVAKTYVADSIGNMVETETISNVYANISSISAKEFFDGGQNGLKPDLKFIVREFEYSSQDTIRHNGCEYSVYRTYSREDGFVELYTEKKVGNQ